MVFSIFRRIELKVLIPTKMVHIYVQTGERELMVEVDKTDTIMMLKSKLEDKTGCPVKDRQLLFNETVIDNGSRLEVCGVRMRDVLFISQVGYHVLYQCYT